MSSSGPSSPVGFINFLVALFYLCFVFPFLVVIEVLSWLWKLATSSWILFALLLLGGVGFGAIRYHNRIQR
jgi:hypothetical protein